ncbi:TIGR04282 family arsenosugar biosynthesis glycosyltransferase [candidate division KSB1 bacterium]
MKTNALVIFAKYPEPGKVKTRLSPELSPVTAAHLYRAMVEDITAEHIGSELYDTILYVDPDAARAFFRDLFGPNVIIRTQKGNDLGSRMMNTFAETFKAGYENTVIIGSDCPGITFGTVRRAVRSLKNNRVVIGPSEDGGYYLIGMSRLVPELFCDMEWSTENVFRQTVSRLDAMEITCSLLEKKYDIDSFHDLENLRDDISRGKITSCIERTSFFLKAHVFDAENKAR